MSCHRSHTLKSCIQQMALGLALVASSGVSAFAGVPTYVSEALSDPNRSEDAGNDARRHPADLLVLSQVKPGDTVVDMVPGSGYYTKLFSKIVGPKGHVYAVWPLEYARIDGDEVLATRNLARDPHYSNVTILMQPAAQFSIPVKADIVWISQNYHDYPDRFMGSVNMVSWDASVLAALKPGGYFIVTDHAAVSGSGMRDVERTHRIDPELVKSQAATAGFHFDGQTDVLRNPRDTHEVNVFMPGIRGYTDQFAFRFRAP